MTHDDLERQLRSERGPREAGYAPTNLPATLDAGRAPGAGPSRQVRIGAFAGVVAAAALAVVLLGGVFSGANPGIGSDTSDEPTPSAVPSIVVPSANPSVAPSTRDCRAEDFAWTSDPWTGAAGSRGTTVLLRGVASLVGCQIDGPAVLVLRDANDQTLLSAETPASAVTVRADTLLEIGVSWSNWCGDAPAAPISLALTLPGDSSEVPLVPPTDGPGPGPGIPVPPCNGAGQPSVLNGTDFQLSDRTPPEG
jgi:hypothetical protein